jgi:uncharacterized protein (UPF0276 family)
VQEDFLPSLKKDKITEFLNQIKADLFSFDFGPACQKNDYILPLSPTLDQASIKQISRLAVEHIRKSFFGRLALENYPYYPTGLYEHICRPDFMAEFLEEMDLGLVLDLGHALVSAANFNLDPEKYIGEMPLERLVEIHLSRPYYHSRLAVDAHDAPGGHEFDLLTNILESLDNPGRILVVIEYYRAPEKLLKLHRRAGRLIKIMNEKKGIKIRP